jgi:hypothetical protein
MLRDLVAQVLGSVGCADDVDRTIAGIESAIAARARNERLGLQFRAGDGELSVELSAPVGRVWQMSCPIP